MAFLKNCYEQVMTVVVPRVNGLSFPTPPEACVGLHNGSLTTRCVEEKETFHIISSNDGISLFFQKSKSNISSPFWRELLQRGNCNKLRAQRMSQDHRTGFHAEDRPQKSSYPQGQHDTNNWGTREFQQPAI